MAAMGEIRFTVEIGPAEAIADLLIGLQRLVDRNEDGDVEDVTLAVRDLLEKYNRSGPTVGLRRDELPSADRQEEQP
jgi:hypothetical protein